MSDTDQEKEDEVLRRMLATKPRPHKPLGKRAATPHKGRPSGAANGNRS